MASRALQCVMYGYVCYLALEDIPSFIFGIATFPLTGKQFKYVSDSYNASLV